MLQPYGSLFFAAAAAFESQLPAVASASANSVVIVRLRGRTDLGTTFMQVLSRYAAALTDAGSKLVLVSASEQIQDQLRAAGVTDVLGPQDIYAGDERVGATFERAYADGTAWIQANQRPTGTSTPGDTEPAEGTAVCEPARPVNSQLEGPESEHMAHRIPPGSEVREAAHAASCDRPGIRRRSHLLAFK